MALMKTNRRYYRAILEGAFCLAMLQSSMLMAASSEMEAGGSASLAMAASATAIVPVPLPIHAITVGHEGLYRRFMESSLEYRPTPGSDAGLITLPFRDLLAPLAGTANPLSGTFDLSRCGDIGKRISINIGYKKAKVPANSGKVEVWICPKFLVEREWATTANYLAPIMGAWEAPYGYFWTSGSEDILGDNYNYLLKGIVVDKAVNLYEKWLDSERRYESPASIICTYMIHASSDQKMAWSQLTSGFSCNIKSPVRYIC